MKLLLAKLLTILNPASPSVMLDVTTTETTTETTTTAADSTSTATSFNLFSTISEKISSWWGTASDWLGMSKELFSAITGAVAVGLVVLVVVLVRKSRKRKSRGYYR